nr:unnamed protein product [Callosobruchus analis]
MEERSYLKELEW